MKILQWLGLWLFNTGAEEDDDYEKNDLGENAQSGPQGRQVALHSEQDRARVIAVLVARQARDLATGARLNVVQAQS